MAAEEYLEDGVYVRSGGFDLILRTRRAEGTHWIALEPSALRKLVAYADRVWGPDWRT